MIAEGRNFIITAPWVVIFPGLAIIVDQLLREPRRRQRLRHRAPGPCALARPSRSTASTVTFAGDGRPVVRGVSFTIASGEAFGLVGESGSGKSLTCRAILRLMPRGASVTGRIAYGARDLLGPRRRRRCRRFAARASRWSSRTR